MSSFLRSVNSESLKPVSKRVQRTKCPQFANRDVDKMRVCVQEKVVNVLLLHRRQQFLSGGKRNSFLKIEKRGDYRLLDLRTAFTSLTTLA